MKRNSDEDQHDPNIRLWRSTPNCAGHAVPQPAVSKSSTSLWLAIMPLLIAAES